MSNGTSIYPRVVCIKESNPEFVRKLRDFGYFDILYLNANLKELFCFNLTLVGKISQYAHKKNVCLKFYTINPKYDDEGEYKVIYLISTNIVINSFNLEVGQSRLKEPIFSREWASYTRVVGKIVIKSLASNLYE